MAATKTKEPDKGQEAGALWTRRIDETLDWRQNKYWNGDKAWRRHISQYKGVQWKADGADTMADPSSDEPRRKITVNRTGSIILSVLPFIVRRNPEFLLRARRAEDVQRIKLKETLLNYLWKEMGMQRQLKRVALDSAVIGHGILKTGYTLELVENKLKDAPANRTVEYREYVKKDEPWIRRISPFRFLFDPDAPDSDLESARWCAEIIFKPVRDVLDNERYDEAARKEVRRALDLSGTQLAKRTKGRRGARKDKNLGSVTTVSAFIYAHTGGDEDFKRKMRNTEKEDERIVLLEIWDKRTGKYYVIAHGLDKPLIEEESWPYDYLEGFPYKMLPFIPVVDEPYPIGIPKWIEDQQYELNRTRTFEFEHRRRFNRKYGADKNHIEPSEVAKFTSGKDGEVVLTDGPPDQVIKPIQDAPLPADQYRIEDLINQDLRELTGADELLQGGALPSRTTATEIGARQQIIGLKVEARVGDFDDFTEAVGRQVLQHVEKNYFAEKVVRIVGPEGASWEPLTVQDIKAEADFELESTSAPRANPDVERQQRVEVFTLLLQSLPILAQLAPFLPNLGIGLTQMLKWVLVPFDRSKEMAQWAAFMLQDAQPLPPQGVLGGASAGLGGNNLFAPPQGSPDGASVPGPNQTGQAAGEGGAVSGALGAAFNLGGTVQ